MMLNAMRLPRTCALVILAALLIGLAGPARAQSPARDKAWWQAVAAKDFAVPADVPLPVLLDDLTAMLGSPDAELRDDLAYTTLAQWIYRQKVVPVDQRLRLLGVWERNLTTGVGDTGTPAVARRSFSALALGILAILDNEAPYLDRPAFAGLLTSALTYLRDEKDVRGFDPALGWLHSVAHTADLIKFLARSQHLQPADQAHILTAISDKLAAVETPLINGEDERLARAVLSIAARPDFDEAAFAAWLKTVAPQRRAVPPTAATLAIDGNRRNLLVSLFTVLSTDRRDLPTLIRARTLVLDTLKTFM